MPEYVIRRMKENEVHIALDWAAQEGWNPGLHDAACFYQADPDGFFIGLLDGNPIATASAVVYDDSYSFGGLYIVKKEYRGHGYGLELTNELHKYAGNRITGIDGVLENVSKYEKIGYVPSHKQIRYEWNGKPSFSLSPNIFDLRTVPISQVEDFDRQYFPAPRAAFLNSWIHQPGGHALGYFNNHHLEGYGVVRKCHEGFKIAPLFAKSPKIAKALFEALCLKTGEGPVYLDIPEPNKNARQLVEHLAMAPKFEVMRMYRNGVPKINLDDGIYGITTFELG